MRDYLIVGSSRQASLDVRYQQLLEAYASALRRLCAAYLTDQADRQDLFQEIALALWKALPRYRGEASERTWLYRVAHNVALSYAGRRRREDRLERPLEEMATEPGVTEGQRHRELLEAVQQLPSFDKQLALLYLEGLTGREMEDVTGISANNVAVRLSRVRQRLAASLRPKEVRR